MKAKRYLALGMAVVLMGLSACGENSASISNGDPSKDELGWDGEWVGDGVSVIISDSDSGFPNVEFNDEAHNATLDEASIEGNTLTGVYRITSKSIQNRKLMFGGFKP